MKMDNPIQLVSLSASGLTKDLTEAVGPVAYLWRFPGSSNSQAAKLTDERQCSTAEACYYSSLCKPEVQINEFICKYTFWH